MRYLILIFLLLCGNAYADQKTWGNHIVETRLGVGTDTPSFPLEVKNASSRIGAESTTGTNSVYFRLRNTAGNTIFGQETSAGGGIFSGTSAYATVLGTASANDLQLITSGAVRATLDSDGKLGIGTDSPTAVLHLKAGTATNPPLKFTSGTLLTTPEAGTIEYDGCRTYVTNVATQRAIDRTSDVAVATVTVENTTTETTIWTGPMAADSLCAGNVFKFHANGIISSDSVGDLMTIRVKVGGVTKATLVGAAKKLDNDHFHIDAVATQRTIGSTGSRAIHIDMMIDEVEYTVTGVATIDTTANMDVTITAQWNNADAGDVLELYQGFMEYKN